MRIIQTKSWFLFLKTHKIKYLMVVFNFYATEATPLRMANKKYNKLKR